MICKQAHSKTTKTNHHLQQRETQIKRMNEMRTTGFCVSTALSVYIHYIAWSVIRRNACQFGNIVFINHQNPLNKTFPPLVKKQNRQKKGQCLLKNLELEEKCVRVEIRQRSRFSQHNYSAIKIPPVKTHYYLYSLRLQLDSITVTTSS